MSSSMENTDYRSESTSGNCRDETEYSKPDLEGHGGRKQSGRKKRTSYDRDFLIKCFHSPASGRKPDGFPIPHLDCTLGLSKVKRVPFATPQPYQPKRKEDAAKRDRDGDDNISLRPHSGNFSGGCGPNLSSPSHATSSNSFTRLHSHEDLTKGGIPYDRDRGDFHRNNFRYGGGGHRREVNDRDRGRMDRDRDMERDHRDRMGRDRMSGSNHRNSNSWSNDGMDNDWSRRRNGAHFPSERNYGSHNKRYDRREEEQEPEWFSGGPSSQHETIELRGFLDDDRRDNKSEDLRNGSGKGDSGHNGDVESGGESTKNENACESPMDLSIEKILKMDHIPGILSNDFLETEEPSGSSRFSQLFKRNSATPVPGPGRAAQYDSQENSVHSKNDADKSKAVHEMGELLRNMLIRKSAPGEPVLEPKKEAAKPPPATKDDVDAFKKLVTPLLEKVLQGPAPQKKVQSGKSPQEEGGNVLDIFKQAPQQKPQQQQQQPPNEGPPMRSSSLQDIFQNMMNKPSAPPAQADVPVMTPNQILLMIPPDMQHLVMNFNITQWDYVQLCNIAKNREWTFPFVLEQFLMQQCTPQQGMIYSGILNLLIHGRLSLPGVIVVDQPMNHGMPQMSQQPMPNHRAPPPNFDKFMQRPVEDGPKDMAKRSNTPVSSMAFTPTSVMRKMTADGTKPMPPPSSQGFVPVPMPGGLLPTPPTTAAVMMNSNNPNLASLMSNMSRPPPQQMHYRPHPPMMGYPHNFPPAMMPPNMHGPVMMPPQYQNLLPNQPVYKPDEN